MARTAPLPDDHADPAELDPRGEVQVWAAGGIVHRPGKKGVEVLVIHRPSRRDWSLPKGKIDPGETLREAAFREILEETGFRCVLGRAIRPIRYLDNGRRTKAVVYFDATPIGGKFKPNSEVDKVKWCRPRPAASRLTYRHDSKLLLDHARAEGWIS